MNEKAAEQSNPPPANAANPPASVANPAKPGLFQNQWQLIVSIAAVIGVMVVIAVLVFEVMEYLHYQQSPSIWPPAVQSK